MLLSALTIFLGAFLLFHIQPMIAKMIRPGSQTALLVGYLCEHRLVRILAPKGQAAVHAALLGLSLHTSLYHNMHNAGI